MQMAKLGVALVKGRTGLSTAEPMETEDTAAPAPAKADSNNHVAPLQFKSLVGKNHAEFGSSRQQVPNSIPIDSHCLESKPQLFSPCPENSALRREVLHDLNGCPLHCRMLWSTSSISWTSSIAQSTGQRRAWAEAASRPLQLHSHTR